jgi:hypothetical protein
MQDWIGAVMDSPEETAINKPGCVFAARFYLVIGHTDRPEEWNDARSRRWANYRQDWCRQTIVC